MRLRRKGATGATLIAATVLAMLAAACGSGGGSKVSSNSVASQMVMGGPPECKTRITCLVGLQQIYGLQFKDFKSLDAGGPLTKSALSNGDIQVARLFSSDEAIQLKGYVILDDDKHFQLAGNIIPVIRTAKATSEVKSLLNEVSKAMTQDDLVTINKAIDINHTDPSDAAKQFVKNKGLARTPSSGSKESITIGSANFAENEALADIYGEVLKSAGYSVTLKTGLGAREIIQPALTSGQLDLIPEYVGNYLNFIDPTVTGGLTLDQTVSKLRTEVASKGLTLLDPSTATDADSIGVTKATADKYHLKKISDLGKAA
ncbi:MAG TPA: glycine betaine ABC transporter substrate-binding protein [Acidimicrobiales bacterium]|nr:glycine betaine ABC transporter substrate-binding protein [Acidimicrobiales bacterium]